MVARARWRSMSPTRSPYVIKQGGEISPSPFQDLTDTKFCTLPSLLSSAIDRFIEDAISLQFVGDSYRRLKWKRREATINAAEDAPQTVAEDQTTPKPSEAAKP